MFLRSLLTMVVFLFGAVPTSAQIYTILAIDVSGSVPFVYLQNDDCPLVMCGSAMLEAQQTALALSLFRLSDPLCLVESHVMVAQWSDTLTPLSAWWGINTPSARTHFVSTVRALHFRIGGGTHQRRAFAEASAELNAVSPAIGAIIMVTDTGARSDGWKMGQEGFDLAETAGFHYVEIVVTNRDTVESLTAQFVEIFNTLHASPFLCLG